MASDESSEPAGKAKDASPERADESSEPAGKAKDASPERADESSEPAGKAKDASPERADEALSLPPNQDLIRLVEDLSPEKRLALVKVLEFTVESTFSGPLPRPEDFEKYNEILPNAAERIMAMAEKEQEMRADRQAGVLANDRARINRATLMGLSLIVVSLVATYFGQTEIALPLGLAGVVNSFFRQVMDWLDQRRSTATVSVPRSGS